VYTVIGHIGVIPFCECFHRPDYEGGHPLGKNDDGTLSWKPDECIVLSTEETYAAVANHRRACQLQPELIRA
jgi:hypothetical protein